jgi:hypothetical protein
MRYAFLMITALVCNIAHAQEVNWGYLSMNLAEDMTEQQVINMLGYQPNKVELDTCGQKSRDGPWQCRIYTFGMALYTSQELKIYFYKSRQDSRWRVNSWSVFP